MTPTNKCQHDGEMKTEWDELTCKKCGWILPSGQRIGIHFGWFPSHESHKEFKKYRTYTGMDNTYPIDATKYDEVQNMTQNNEREAFEKWYQSQFTGKVDFKRYSVNSIYYDNDDIETSWEAWEARAQSTISQNEQQESVTNLWEALGKWSAYLASNGEQANLAPPSWLIDAVSSATSPPKQIPDGWKPIDTAPHDEAVLVAGGDCNYPCVASWSGHHEDVWCVDGQMDSYAEIGWPTHWMPLDSLPELPAAPTNTEVGE